jgi:ABC-type Fe3+ transport system permease subunit
MDRGCVEVKKYTGKQVDRYTGIHVDVMETRGDASLFTCVRVYLSRFNRTFLWLPPLFFLGLFFFYPFIRIIALIFNLNTLTSENLSLSYHVLSFTLYQAFLSTFLTILLGLPAAYLFARFEFRGKSLLRALTAVPFMLPTVVVAAGFNALLGPHGWIQTLSSFSNFFLPDRYSPRHSPRPCFL